MQLGLAVHAVNSGQQLPFVQAMHALSFGLGEQLPPDGPHVPWLQLLVQHSAFCEHEPPSGWQAAHVPWKQMLEQHSLARLHPLPSVLQLPQVPS
jgi:hypothetical protein